MTGKQPCPHCSADQRDFDRKLPGFICQSCKRPLPIPPQRIFLSYGHDTNEPLVLRIFDGLKMRGHDVWFDKNDIKAGDDWRREITNGILTSNRVLSFLSRHSVREPGVCRDEIAIAIGAKGGNIQTLLVESEANVQAPVNIGHIQWLDMHDWKDHYAAGTSDWERWYDDKFAEIVRVVESLESLHFAGEIEALAQYLQPIPSDSRIATLLEKGFIGRRWLFDAVERWRTDPDGRSRMLWIRGQPGSGKSAFAAQLAYTRSATVIAAQFIEWDKPDHRDPARILRSIAFQLATRLPDYRALLLASPEIHHLDGKKNTSELFDYLLTTPLRRAISGNRERYLVVLDALDEAESDGKNVLAETLARNAQRLPDWLGLVVTSRPESDVVAPFQHLTPFPLSTDAEDNCQDIRDYVLGQLGKLLSCHGNASTLLEEITRRSEGNFLYAAQFCVAVLEGNLSLSSPRNFPQGLSGIYFDNFRRRFTAVKDYRHRVAPLLGLVVVAKAPIPVRSLAKLLNMREIQVREILRQVGTLLSVERQEGTDVVKAEHKTVSEWLMDSKRSFEYSVDVDTAYERIAEFGWSYVAENATEDRDFFVPHLPFYLTAIRDPVRLLQLVFSGTMNFFELWSEKGLFADGLGCLEFLSANFPQNAELSPLRPIIDTQLAALYNRVNQPERAVRILNQLLQQTNLGHTAEKVWAVAWHELASSELSTGNIASAGKAFRRALKISRRVTPLDRSEVAANLIGLAIVAYLIHLRTERTIWLGRLAYENATLAQSIPLMAEACRVLADAYKDDLRTTEAEDALANGLALAERAGAVHTRLSLLVAQGWFFYQQCVLGELPADRAEKAFNSAIQAANFAHDARYLADAWSGLGQLGVFTQNDEVIAMSLAELTACQSWLPAHLEARRLLLAAAQQFRIADYTSAQQIYGDTERLSRQKGLWSRAVDAIVGQGGVALYSGHAEEAEGHWQRLQDTLPLSPRFKQVTTPQVLECIRARTAQCPL